MALRSILFIIMALATFGSYCIIVLFVRFSEMNTGAYTQTFIIWHFVHDIFRIFFIYDVYK